MKKKEVKVHGSIFFLLKKFVTNSFSQQAWENLLKEANTSTASFELTQSYPINEIMAIVNAASRHTGLSSNEIQEKFGHYLVPDLFKLYADYLKPEWKTFDVLVNTEIVMHGAVRRLNSTANPPILNVTRVHNQLLIIDYFSERRMGSLAVGIIKGIANYFNEEENIKVIPFSDQDAERVQIRIEFK